jgi:amino acid permease
MNSVAFEALIVGLLVIVIGMVLHYISLKVYGEHDLNDMKVFAIHLFVIGIITHLLCEYTGINKWYCTNGVACK